jgi:hypothetical protein
MKAIRDYISENHASGVLFDKYLILFDYITGEGAGREPE